MTSYLLAAWGLIWIKAWWHCLSLHLALFQALNICRSDSKAAMEDVSSCQSAEQTSSEPQRKKDSPHRHFRQRSASDTTNATLHLSESPSTFHFHLLCWHVLYFQCILIWKWIATWKKKCLCSAAIQYYWVCSWCREAEYKLQRAASEYRWPAGDGRGSQWKAGRIRSNTTRNVYLSNKHNQNTS